MLIKTIKYTDYDGNKREEDFCFNLSRAELAMMENSEIGGMKKRLERILQSQDTVAIMEVFKDFIHRSYGEKSPDGKRFIKSEELSIAFEQTEAYSELIMEILSDPNFAASFIQEIMPSQLVEEAKKQGLIKSIDKGAD